MSEYRPEDGNEQCPLVNCGKTLGDGHWYAKPNPNSPMAYHTDKRGIARHWEHIDGLDVTPGTDPFAEGTVGHRSPRTRTNNE